MSLYNKTMLTAKGLLMLSQAQTGHRFEITKVQLGAGFPSNGNVRSLTNLVSPKMSMPVQNVEIISNERVNVTAGLSNITLSKGFIATEMGVFARIDGGAEQLYAYTYVSSVQNADFIPAYDGVNLVNETVDIAIVAGDASTVNLNVEVPSTIGIGVVRKGKGYRIFHDGTINLNGRLRKPESYSNGIWTINFPQAFDCESVVVTPELYGAVSAEIPSFAILEKTSKYCKVKASAPSEGLSWVAVGRTLDDVIKYGSFSYGAGAKIGH